MSIVDGGSLGTTSRKTTVANISLTTTAAYAAGDVVVVFIAKDSSTGGTTGTDRGEITSVTINGQTATKAGEVTQGTVAATGVTTGIWYAQMTASGASGITITANFASVQSAVIGARKYTIGASSAIATAGTLQSNVQSGANASAMTVGSLTSGEYLWFRAIGWEQSGTLTYTATTSWTSLTGTAGVGTTGGSAATNIGIAGEFLIATATTETSQPTLQGNIAHADLMFALQETSSSVTGTLAANENGDAASLSGTLSSGTWTPVGPQGGAWVPAQADVLTYQGQPLTFLGEPLWLAVATVNGWSGSAASQGAWTPADADVLTDQGQALTCNGAPLWIAGAAALSWTRAAASTTSWSAAA